MFTQERMSAGAFGALGMGYWAWVMTLPYSIQPGSTEMTFTIAGLVLGTVIFEMFGAILGLVLWLTVGFRNSIPCYLIGALITGACAPYLNSPIGYGQWVGAAFMFFSTSVAASFLIYAAAPSYFARRA